MSALSEFVQSQLKANQLLTDTELLSLAQAEPAKVTDSFQVGSGVARGFFVFNGIWKTLRTVATDLTNPLSDLCDAVVITASDANSYFGIDPSKAAGQANLAGLQTLVDAKILTAQQKVDFLDLSKTTVDEFNSVTLAEIAQARLTYNQANKIYTSKIVQYTGQQLNLTLNATLPTNCAATLWITETGYLQENAGRAVYLSQVGKYKLNLSGIAQGELEVRVPFANADFGVN